jgi:hypothetical protein
LKPKKVGYESEFKVGTSDEENGGGKFLATVPLRRGERKEEIETGLSSGILAVFAIVN